MRRWLFVSLGALAVTGCLLLVAIASTWTSKKAEPGKTASQGRHTITVTPWGPSQEMIDAVKSSLPKNPAVQRYLKGSQYSLIQFEFVDPETKPARSEPPNLYRATFFDYTNNRAIVAEGRFDDAAVRVSESLVQPNPSPEEFQEAVAILSKDPKIGPALSGNAFQVYPAMPPLVDAYLPAGKVERTITVGLMPHDGDSPHEVVGVNMIRRSVVRYPEGAPKSSAAVLANCGVPSAGQGSTSRGVAGQFQVVISRDGIEFWRFLVIRPSASSGVDASGIELRDVSYFGKRVLGRAHAPILNVQYERNSCGPFRDWSWQEGFFTANGTDVPGTNGGIRICTDNPQTMLDNGLDFGNFRGVAIYDNREEVRLVSELNAGWYRYISEWRFRDEGIIQPLFGYGATTNGCVCRIHTHHVYWRFDFDIITTTNNRISEGTEGFWKLLEVEEMRLRNGSVGKWLVENSVTGEGVIIEPGHRDGNADKYGVGDLWLLTFKPNQIDDNGQPPGGSQVKLNPFINGESIVDQDIVVWYAGHWRHDNFNSPEVNHGSGPNTQGPELKLQRY